MVRNPCHINEKRKMEVLLEQWFLNSSKFLNDVKKKDKSYTIKNILNSILVNRQTNQLGYSLSFVRAKKWKLFGLQKELLSSITLDGVTYSLPLPSHWHRSFQFCPLAPWCFYIRGPLWDLRYSSMPFFLNSVRRATVNEKGNSRPSTSIINTFSGRTMLGKVHGEFKDLQIGSLTMPHTPWKVYLI